MYENFNVKPITCPICGSRELAFVTEYHKAIGLKIFLGFLKAALFLTWIGVIFSFFENPATGFSKELRLTGNVIVPISIAILLLMAIVKGIIISVESKTHVQSICKNCGNLWLLD